LLLDPGCRPAWPEVAADAAATAVADVTTANTKQLAASGGRIAMPPEKKT